MPTQGATQIRATGLELSVRETEPACCVPAQGKETLLATEAEALALRFKALADPNRLRILSIVSSSENAETCVCDLAEPLNLGQPTVSHHLKIMVEAGLLNREKRGVWAYYSLVPGALGSLAATLIPKD
ncbi:ArsR/SmtB family transcription factor [Paeniglutamicibacter terrestris]|uniref:Winged helix-turn-helix transcriptional regulator n=1 Tax=Paeniglutamicibacter terrestris TaxID=2723403 RepID=A0ABX1G8K3_9MICC|nr:metalloregulator ArsR/SmtB family transcription factor [Paeniglutamicibacter terrestris]ASN39959.1 transcriptional regulator [Arthrobacter sp. 7749]NKG22582.1 winged helix-turn-helix transcriptional regulator [Paeniglutamicibacter terrestris]